MLYGTPSAMSALRCVRCRFKYGSPVLVELHVEDEHGVARRQGRRLRVPRRPRLHQQPAGHRVPLRLVDHEADLVVERRPPFGVVHGEVAPEFPYALGTFPFASAHGSQNLHLCIE